MTMNNVYEAALHELIFNDFYNVIVDEYLNENTSSEIAALIADMKEIKDEKAK